jgi:hypothetical protein
MKRLVIKYQNDRLEEGTAPKTINEEVGFLYAFSASQATFFECASAKEDAQTEGSQSYRQSVQRGRKQRMLGEAAKARSPHIYLALTLALNAGMRDAEIKSFVLDADQFCKEIPSSRPLKTEGGEGRTIPLELGPVCCALTDYVEWYKLKFGATRPEWYVFPSDRPSRPTRRAM